MRKQRDADQIHSHCEADQRFCFRHTDSMIPLIKSEISSSKPSLIAQAGLCQTWSEPKLLVFSCTGSNNTTAVI